MTETELSDILQRLESLEAEVRQLAESVKQLLTAKTEDPRSGLPGGDIIALRERTETYTARKEAILTAHPHIVKIPGVQGGEPIVRGVIKTVRGIVELTRLGMTPQQIVDEYSSHGLTLAHVYDALSYYYDNLEEMDETITGHKAAMEEAIRISHEQQATRA